MSKMAKSWLTWTRAMSHLRTPTWTTRPRAAQMCRRVQSRTTRRSACVHTLHRCVFSLFYARKPRRLMRAPRKVYAVVGFGGEQQVFASGGGDDRAFLWRVRKPTLPWSTFAHLLLAHVNAGQSRRRFPSNAAERPHRLGRRAAVQARMCINLSLGGTHLTCFFAAQRRRLTACHGWFGRQD